MKKSEFFLNAVNAGNLKKKTWILKAFSLTLPKEDENIPWNIRYYRNEGDETRLYCEFTNGDNEVIHLDDYEMSEKSQEPPFKFTDPIVLEKGAIANVFEKTKTRYGNVVANWLWCVYPFGSKIPFFTGRFLASDVEKKIEPLLTSLPKDPDAVRDPDKIYIDEHINFTRVKGIIDGLSQLCVPSATEKTLTHHPDRDKVRKELLEKYKDQLDDPAVAAIIDKAMVDLDKEWLKGDKAMGFFASAKGLEIARKKTHGLMGLESAFSDVGVDPTYIASSLDDGWDRTKMPAICNNSREGSFDRGFQTALGGKGTKDILKILQNCTLVMTDCGSKQGIDVVFTEKDYKEYIGNTLIVGGKLVRITKENFNKFAGKPQVMRTAGYCKAEKPNFCQTCIGGKYENHPTGLATAGAAITTKFMLIFMKSAHGKALKTTEYDIMSELT